MGLPHKLNRIEYESHLTLQDVSSDFHSVFFYFHTVFCDFHTVFLYYPINQKELIVF